MRKSYSKRAPRLRLRKPPLLPAVLLSLIAGGNGTASGAQVVWLPTTSGQWHAPQNWSSNPLLPGAADDVSISPRADREVIVSTSVPSIRSLGLQRNLSITPTGSLKVLNSLSQSDGILRVAGTLEVASGTARSLTLTVDDVSRPGQLVVNGDFAIDILEFNSGTRITGPGTTTMTGRGTTFFGTIQNHTFRYAVQDLSSSYANLPILADGARFEITNGSILDAREDADFRAQGAVRSTVVNNGTFVVSPQGFGTPQSLDFQPDLLNTGSVDIDGSAIFNGDVTITDGSFNINGSAVFNALLRMTGGSIGVGRNGRVNLGNNAILDLVGGGIGINGQVSGGSINNSGSSLIIGNLVTPLGATFSGGFTNIQSGGHLKVGVRGISFAGNNSPRIIIDGGFETPGIVELAEGATGGITFSGTAGTARISTEAFAGELLAQLRLGSAVRTFNINDGSAAVDTEIAAQVSNGGVNKSGQGTLRLVQENIYTLGTIISAGVVQAAHPKALGSGAVTFTGGSLALRPSTAEAVFTNALNAGSSNSILIDVQRDDGSSGPLNITMSSLVLGSSMNVSGASAAKLRFPGEITLQAPVIVENSPELIFEGRISGGHPLTKSGPGALTFKATTANQVGAVRVTAGLLNLSSPANVPAIGALTIEQAGSVKLLSAEQIKDDQLVTLNASAGNPSLELNGLVETAAGLRFIAGGSVNTGGGTLRLASDIGFSGSRGTGTINGKLQLLSANPQVTVANGSSSTDLALRGNVQGSGGIVKLGPGALLINGELDLGAAILANEGALVLGSSAAFSPKMANATKIDLNAGLIVQASSLLTSASLLSIGQLRAELIKGRNASGGVANGRWDGLGGINSSMAKAAFTQNNNEKLSIGYALNSALLSPVQSFFGVSVSPADILVRLTRNADANLDGVVNNTDITVLAGFYRPGVSGKHWYQADFNYDGFVDNNDITILAGFYAPNEAPHPSIAIASTISAVPEPSIVIAALASCVMIRRWRQKP